MLCNQEHATRMAKLVFTLRQRCAHKDNHIVQNLGITTSEYMCLFQFIDHNILGAKQLAKKLEITSGGLTRILTSLEDKGIIKRRISDEDRRNINVHLTGTGNNIVAYIRRTSLDLYTQNLNRIKINDRQPLMQVIEHLIEAIDNWIALYNSNSEMV